MKKIYSSLFIIAAIIALFGCGSKKNDVAPALIVGKWNLQEQDAQTYLNGTKTSDSVYLASADKIAYAQFNTDQTYTSSSYIYGVQLGTRAIIASATATGSYSYTASKFSTTGSLAGINLAITGGSGPAPVITLTSLVEQVTQISASKLVIFFDITANYTVNGVTDIHRTVNTMVYTR